MEENKKQFGPPEVPEIDRIKLIQTGVRYGMQLFGKQNKRSELYRVFESLDLLTYKSDTFIRANLQQIKADFGIKEADDAR